MLHENDNIFKSMKDITFEDTVSHQCGVTMNDSVEARAIADVMSRHDHIKVTYMPAMIRIDGDRQNGIQDGRDLGGAGSGHDPASFRNFNLDALRPHGHDR